MVLRGKQLRFVNRDAVLASLTLDLEGLDERTNTLNGFEYTDIRTTQAIAEADFEVRRLTVNECEVAQGFPAGYTDIEYRGKPAADNPRYKAIGNSMAVPVCIGLVTA